MLDNGTQEWREDLSDIPDEMLAWQPFPNGHSIGTLILHIADVEAYWLHEVGGGLVRPPEELAVLLSEETQQFQAFWPTPPPQPLSWFLARHEEIRARTRQIVRDWDASAYVSPAQDFEVSRRWLLHHVLTHEAYHSGQAVLLSILHARR